MIMIWFAAPVAAPPLFAASPEAADSARAGIDALFSTHEQELGTLLKPLEQLAPDELAAIGGERIAAATAEAWEVNAETLALLIPRQPTLVRALPPAGGAPSSANATAAAAASKAADYSSPSNIIAHLVRDWSEEGDAGRARTYRPVLRALDALRRQQRVSSLRVLVPGAGACRLAWEVARVGHRVEANDASIAMLHAARTLMAAGTVDRAAAPRLFPRVRCAAGVMDRAACLSSCAVGLPKPAGVSAWARTPASASARPPLALTLQLGEWDRGYDAPGRAAGFDALLTSYFFDVLPDPSATIRRARELLGPGGAWINVGPLLWHDAAAGLLRLSLREVRALLLHHGFTLSTLKIIRKVPYLAGQPAARRPPRAGGGGGRRRLPLPWRREAQWLRSNGHDYDWHDVVFWVARTPL